MSKRHYVIWPIKDRTVKGFPAEVIGYRVMERAGTENGVRVWIALPRLYATRQRARLKVQDLELRARYSDKLALA